MLKGLKSVLTFCMVMSICFSTTACNGSSPVPVAAEKTDIVVPSDTKLGEVPKPEEPKEPVVAKEEKPVLPELFEYSGPIYHIFTHALIAFPDVNRAKGGPLDKDCVTPVEYKRMLEELYKNNFVLIDINSTFESKEQKGKQVVVKKKLMLPKDKKPLILTVDDIVYDEKKMDWGMVHKIIMDQNGDMATYTKLEDGQEVTSYDNEVIPILDQFVKEHPDFSINGAKATLAVTGWMGVLGYRIARKSPNSKSEIEAVKPIIQKLKDTGWNFASHSFGHRHEDKITFGLFADDTKSWNDQIASVVGPTQIYVFPYGEQVQPNDQKYKMLIDYGFKMLCGVGFETTWKERGNSILSYRACVDGYSLANNKKYLAPFFDTEKVLEPGVRKTNLGIVKK